MGCLGGVQGVPGGVQGVSGGAGGVQRFWAKKRKHQKNAPELYGRRLRSNIQDFVQEVPVGQMGG